MKQFGQRDGEREIEKQGRAEGKGGGGGITNEGPPSSKLLRPSEHTKVHRGERVQKS